MVRFLLFFLLIINFNAYATAQFPDLLILEGEEVRIYNNPLEPYFNRNPDKTPEGWGYSTALSRGYQAVFSITNQRLVVKDIRTMKETENGYDKWHSVIEEVFPESSNKVVKWFNGLLISAHGERVNIGYNTEYEFYTLFLIRAGQISNQIKYSLEEYNIYKKKQFEKYQLTEQYNQKKAEYLTYMEKNKDSFDVDSFIFRKGDFTQKIYVEFE